MIDRGGEALAKGCIRGLRQELDLSKRRADGPDAGEKGVAGEVVPARQRGVRGRQQSRLERHEIARRHVRRLAGGDADASRYLLSRHAVGALDRNHHTRPDRPQVDFLDRAGERHDADAIEDRRGHPSRAQRHRQKPAKHSRECQRDAERDWARSREISKRGESQRQRDGRPQRGLAVGRQVERDPAHRCDREPQEKAALLDLARQRLVENVPPSRRPRGRARQPSGGRQNARAPRCAHALP
jgi:hypothetical protein